MYALILLIMPALLILGGIALFIGFAASPGQQATEQLWAGVVFWVLILALFVLGVLNLYSAKDIAQEEPTHPDDLHDRII